jgi:ABC-2 type transport system permease protein
VIVLVIFITIIIGLNSIPFLIKRNFPKWENRIGKILIFSAIFFGLFTILSFEGYCIKGVYTYTIIGVIFILTTLSYFATVKYTKRKLIIVIIMSPIIFCAIFFLMILGEITVKLKINETYKIEISNGGVLVCGDTFKITKSKYGIFEKTLFCDKSLRLSGIKKIKILKFNENLANFLIYHDGKMDSENPYRYEIKNKNKW